MPLTSASTLASTASLQAVLQLVVDERLQAGVVQQPVARDALGEVRDDHQAVLDAHHGVDRWSAWPHPRPPRRRCWSARSGAGRRTRWWCAPWSATRPAATAPPGPGQPDPDELLADDGGTRGRQCLRAVGQHLRGDLSAHALEAKVGATWPRWPEGQVTVTQGPITSANSALIAFIVASSSRILAIASAMSRAVFSDRLGRTPSPRRSAPGARPRPARSSCGPWSSRAGSSSARSLQQTHPKFVHCSLLSESAAAQHS